MKRKRFRAPMILLMFAFCLLMFPTQVHANAVSDIMTSDRFTGAVETISWLTDIVDYYFAMAITATAFFIISAALLKNACAGAYCSNPKFWNKVAEAHESMEAKTLANVKDFFGSGGIMNTSAGGLSQALLAIVPNIKAFTDFDDVEMEPKQYWIKAIPQMLACVVIGVFIYNGYYRDTASLVGNFGSEICNRVFTSVDPSSFIDTLTRTSKTPPNIYAEDPSLQGEFNHAFSTEMYKVALGDCKDIKDYEDKTRLMRDAENAAQALSNGTMATAATASGADFWSENRTYDYKIQGLSIVAVTGSSASTGESFTCNPAAADDFSSFSCSGYVQASTFNSLANLNHSEAYYYTFTMKGTIRDENKQGLSGVTASASDFGGSAVPAIDVTLALPMETRNGQTVASGGPYNILSNPNMSTQITDSYILQHITANSEDAASGTKTALVWSNYEAGTATTPQISGGATLDSVHTCYCKVTYKTSEGKVLNFKVPVNVTIKAKTN